MRVADIGEFALIDRLADIARATYDEGVIEGIGDDAAVVRLGCDVSVLTTDMLVDGVHFDSSSQPFASIGHRAMTANISDVAAMAARPRYAVVCLGIPADALIGDLEELYTALVNCAARFDVAVVGGDITAAPGLVLTVALAGCLPGEKVPRRGAGRAGDTVLVTGFPGQSAAGLAVSGSLERPSDPVDVLVRAHLFPEARVLEAAAAASAGVECMQDISDGLARDLRHICSASGLGAVIDRTALPVSDDLASFCSETSRSPEDFILGGGEDFEMLMTCSPALVKSVIAAVGKATGVPITPIGTLDPSLRGVWLRSADGTLTEAGPTGYEHFG